MKAKPHLAAWKLGLAQSDRELLGLSLAWEGKFKMAVVWYASNQGKTEINSHVCTRLLLKLKIYSGYRTTEQTVG